MADAITRVDTDKRLYHLNVHKRAVMSTARAQPRRPSELDGGLKANCKFVRRAVRKVVVAENFRQHLQQAACEKIVRDRIMGLLDRFHACRDWNQLYAMWTGLCSSLKDVLNQILELHKEGFYVGIFDLKYFYKEVSEVDSIIVKILESSKMDYGDEAFLDTRDIQEALENSQLAYVKLNRLIAVTRKIVSEVGSCSRAFLKVFLCAG